jgi:ADP-dependent NAD(P)H-hydrate dehydratase / NAD(P)H-hydrate epimerase
VIYVLTAEEMRAADASAGDVVGRPTLMRNAGERIAQCVRAIVPPGPVVAFAGPGDNGGDAFAAFAALGPSYERIIYGEPAPKPSEARRLAEQRARDAGVTVKPLPERDEEARAATRGAALAIDALFGTGSRLPLGERYRAAARALDGRETSVLAIDIPSGIDATTGAVSDVAVRATETLTLAALKPGLLLETARPFVGDLWCAQIGIDDATLARCGRSYGALDDSAFLSMLPKRELESDKRKAGAPLVIAGSRQFPGAAVLCALGAARAGAGYVTVATPAAAASPLRMHLVEQVVVELDDAAPVEQTIAMICDTAQRNSAIAIGPGLGLEERVGTVVREVIARTSLPCVADASALFHLGKHLEALRGKPIVLTPHAGEFARLSGKGTIRDGDRVARLRDFVDRTGITTLLKGLATLVYGGNALFINTTGTNALATAGTGDVLTGVIATLLSQGLSPYDAARVGAYWHGLAGKLAAERRSRGVIARDVIDALPAAVPATRGSATLVRVF